MTTLWDNTLKVNGTGQAVNSTAEEVTLIAAPGAGKRIYVQNVVINIILAATGATGMLALEDGSGGTRFIEASADALGGFCIDFGSPGYPLSLNTLLNLTVDGAGTNEATVRATVTGIVL